MGQESCRGSVVARQGDYCWQQAAKALGQPALWGNKQMHKASVGKGCSEPPGGVWMD